ncbi:hypothetical protein L9F63_005344, partial [Diploptera punctata]
KRQASLNEIHLLKVLIFLIFTLECPVCGEDIFLPTGRNHALENIAALIVYPCPNREHGCKEALRIDDEETGALKCGYSVIDCPFNNISLVCVWKGPIADLRKHLFKKHINPLDYFETNEIFEQLYP